MRLKVVTFNIRHGRGMDGRQDLSRTIEAIRQCGADLVGLQEVDRHYGPRSGWEDQPALLAESLGLHVTYGANLDLGPVPERGGLRRQYGNAILSRFPITYSYNHKLPQVITPGSWNEARGLLEAHIRLEGRTVRLFNTHLGLARRERVAQIRYLLNLYRSSDEACIITGDFNAVPGSAEMLPIRLALRDAYSEVHGGHHVGTLLTGDGKSGAVPVRCIDYIFCSPEFRAVGAATLSTYASDHLPLTASLVG